MPRQTSRFFIAATLCSAQLLAISGCGADVDALFSPPGMLQSNGAAGAPSSGAGDSAGGAVGGEAGSVSGGTGSGGTGSAGRSDARAGAGGRAGADGRAGAAGDGGSAGALNIAGAGGAPPPSVCDSKLAVPAASIATFESGVAGWAGYLDGVPFGLESSQPGAASTERALRFSGGNAMTSGFFHLLPCSDVSKFDGIEFWGKGRSKFKSEADDNGGRVRFLAVIPATDPTPDIGDCREPDQKCSDHPGFLLSFGPEWQQFRVPFAGLKQYGWGTKARFASVINAVLWINDGPVDSFDISIDEIRLYKTASSL